MPPLIWFFANGRDALKGQRLGPFEKFTEMIDDHRDGIAAFRRPENKGVPLGFVGGLNNETRAYQRRAYNPRVEAYLRLEALAGGPVPI